MARFLLMARLCLESDLEGEQKKEAQQIHQIRSALKKCKDHIINRDGPVGFN